jgi:CRP-like cAMP-binding protein
MRIPFDAGMAHYDPPPPETILDLEELRDADRFRLAEYGPGALLGERAHLEGGLRTSTLVAVTPCRVASVEASQLERGALHELSKGHRREVKRPKQSVRA